MKNKFNSSVLHNGYIYGLDEGNSGLSGREHRRAQVEEGRFGYGQIVSRPDT